MSRWSGLRLAIVSVLSPCFVVMTVSLSSPSSDFCVFAYAFYAFRFCVLFCFPLEALLFGQLVVFSGRVFVLPCFDPFFLVGGIVVVLCLFSAGLPVVVVWVWHFVVEVAQPHSREEMESVSLLALVFAWGYPMGYCWLRGGGLRIPWCIHPC